MAIRIGNVVKRDLQEQVEKNKQDIAKHYEIDRVLSDWGIKVLGVVNTPSDIPEGIYEYGDAYGVRTGSGIVYYVWTRANINIGQDEDYWLDIGALSLVGPTGPQGLQGPQGIQGVRGSLWVSSTTAPTSQFGNNGDQWLDTTTGDVYQKGTSTWDRTGNIKGPQGIQGPTGPKGEQGIQGPTGSQGPKGDTGSSFKIGGLLNSIDNLPTPTEANRSIGYAVKRQDNTYDLYVVVGTDNLQWVNMGRVEGVEGPQGPVGPQGPAGADIQIVTITGIPSTATQGTLTQEQVQTLLAHPGNYIQFFNENFYPQDVETDEGYIVYSHVGMFEGNTKIKTITLTIATGGWVLTETSLVSAPISIVNELPEANEENFEKGKIYTTGELLQYISKVVLSEGVLRLVNTLPQELSGTSAAAVGTDIYVFGGTSFSYKYSTVNNTISSLPQGLSGTSAAVGTDIYVFASNKTIYKYSTTTGIVSTMTATLPRELNSTSAAVVGTDIYIFGGWASSGSSTQYYNTIYKYASNNDTITTMTATLPRELSNTSAAAIGTDIYIFGGYNGSYLNSIYKYSTTTGIVSTMTATLPQKLRGTSAAVVGTDIYIFGGGISSSTRADTIYKYASNNDTITTMSTTLPQTLADTSAAVVGTDIYIFGGMYKTNYRSNTIYNYKLGYEYTFKTISTQ